MGYRSIVWALALIALLAAPAADAWANGAAGGAGSCLVDNPGGGAVAVRGAASVLVHDAYAIHADGTILEIHFGPLATDFTLVLEKGSVAATFRTRLVTPVVGLDNENLACRLLNPADTSQSDVVAAVTALVEHIRTTFGLRPGGRFVITPTSISGPTPSSAMQVPGTTAATNVVGLTIWWQPL